ncbi:hypothetical protein KL941_003756 [Ogataea angusta]|nr:hypothetical protein KL941_003756 [Ogataea angusta]
MDPPTEPNRDRIESIIGTPSCDENLAHDDVADVGVLAPEADHKTAAEEQQRQTEAQTGVFEVFGDTHVDSKEWRPEARADVVDLGHITGVLDAQVINHNDETVVVEVPAVETEVAERSEHTGAQDSPVSEQLVSDEVRLGKPLLPDGKHREQQHADNDHGNERGRLVGGPTVGLEREWKQKQGEGRHENECSHDVELVEVVHRGLPSSSSGVAFLQNAHLDGLQLVEFEHECEREEHARHHNGKDPVAPSPGCNIEDRLGGQRAGESGADERSRRKRKRKRSVSETAGVGKEHVHDQVDGVITDPVQHITGSVRVRVVARSKNNQTQQVDTHKHNKALGTAPDVQGLTDRQLQHAAHDGCQDSRGADFGSFGEIRVRIRHHGGSDGLLQRQHEETHPDPRVGGVHGPFRPDHGGGLDGLQAFWGVGADFARAVNELAGFLVFLRLRKEGVWLLVGPQDGF